ncbi:MAG: flagellar hook-basal body protein, partial [Lachnospiraceae bacterium]|nr:flagellar hook-basal body protein [Lachnospiraceae bacterium]
MVKGLYTAFTGMVQEQRRLDVLSNNLANSTTIGYKKEGATSVAFADELAIRIKDTSVADLPVGIGDINLGVKVGELYTDYSQGSIRVTDESSDLAIAGDGFFAIEYTDKQGNTSVKYTRNGEFTVDKDGYFRTSDGDYLLNQAGAMSGGTGQGSWVRVDPLQDYTIDSQGMIYQNGAVVGQVGVVDIEDYNYLAKYGENLYDLVDGGNVIASDASVEQGCLEASNVNVVDEMVSMITIQRAYEAGQKMIQTEDSTL